ncbi:MAG: serine/threonine-protein phosphatase [Phycisphaerae bacterium]|nr:serine/threonine-protein phosphatase [Phycisphaerae bacterium]
MRTSTLNTVQMLADAAFAPSDAPDVPGRTSNALRLVCSEIAGGNRAIERPVELPGMAGVIYSRPCDGGRGGDVHYLSVCSAGYLSRLCIADVVGHGEAVATFSAEAHRLLRRAMNTPDQRRVLSAVNRRLEQIGFRAMTTAAVATYDAIGRRLSISYAGHPPAWFFRSGEDRWSRVIVREGSLDGGLANLPLGVDAATSYDRTLLSVEPGDRLLLLTDGVLEARDPRGELFGDSRIDALLHAHRRASCAQLGAMLHDALAEFTGTDSPSHDDVTYVLVGFRAGPKGSPLGLLLKNLIRRAF